MIINIGPVLARMVVRMVCLRMVVRMENIVAQKPEQQKCVQKIMQTAQSLKQIKMYTNTFFAL